MDIDTEREDGRGVEGVLKFFCLLEARSIALAAAEASSNEQKIYLRSNLLFLSTEDLWKLVKLLGKSGYIVDPCKARSENTHCWGKDHCMAGLQFDAVKLFL